MTVRCKMRVVEKKDVLQNGAYAQQSSKLAAVKLQAVSDDQNKSWAKYTPYGVIELSIDNPEAVDQCGVPAKITSPMPTA